MGDRREVSLSKTIWISGRSGNEFELLSLVKAAMWKNTHQPDHHAVFVEMHKLEGPDRHLGLFQKLTAGNDDLPIH